MTGLEAVLSEVESVSRDFDRRTFLKYVGCSYLVPAGTLEPDEERFFRAVTGRLISAEALHRAGIDPVANLRHLLAQSPAVHRDRLSRLIRGLRRIAFLYGGDAVALNGRASRFLLVQKAARALASLCLLCVWGDPRSFALIDEPVRSS